MQRSNWFSSIKLIFFKSLPQCCEWLLRLWGCIRARGITPEKTWQSLPVTLLCSCPALPSLQPPLSPAGRGRPSTWTGPSLLPGSGRWRPGTWPGWLDCRRERSDERPPKKQASDSVFTSSSSSRSSVGGARLRTISTERSLSSQTIRGLTDFGIT